MRLFAVLSFLAIFVMAGCETPPLGDKTQRDNFAILTENWEYMNAQMEGVEDDPATPDVDESVDPQIPIAPLRESFTDLLREAFELEKAKRETWQEQAEEEGWKKPNQ